MKAKWILALFVAALLAQTPVIIKDQAGSGNAATVTGAAALKVDNSAVTQPVSNAGTFAVQAAQSGTWTVTGSGGTFPVTGTFWPYTLGQQLASASVPVILPSATVTTLTQPTLQSGSTTAVTQATAANLNATVVGTGTFAAQVTGSVTANAGTNLNTSALALETGGNLATVAGAVSASVMQDNLKQVNGVTTLTGAGVTGTGSQRNTVAQDSTTVAGSTPDPCAGARTTVTGAVTSGTQIITGTSAKQTYLCFFSLVLNATADNIALVEGTGSVCAAGTAGMYGGTTAATGWNLLASASVTLGTSSAWWQKTATLADNVCLLASSGAQIIYMASYVQQ